MRLTILSFTAAVLWLQQQASLPPPLSLVLSGIGGLVLLFLPCRLRLLPSLLSGAACGVAWAGLAATLQLAHSLPTALEGRDLLVTGIVDSLPDETPQGLRFQLRVEQATDLDGASVTLPPRLGLSWYGQFHGRVTQTVGQVEPGARWRLQLRLQRPHGNVNPHGGDYEAWLLEQGIRATGYVRDSPQNARLDDFVPRFSTLVEKCRAYLRARIRAALPDAPYRGVIVALVIGDQRGVAAADWDVFMRTGIGHLISISGLHITMLAGLSAAAASWLWRRAAWRGQPLPLLLPAQKAAAAAGLGTALLYVLLAGFGVPAQRTLYMLAVVALAQWQGRLTGASQVLCLALGIAVLCDPMAVLAPGFWLSFAAVGVIFYAGTGRAGQLRGWRALLYGAAHLQWAITIGLVPLTLLLFGQVSLVSPLANAVAIPLVSFVVTPLALAGSVLPAPLAGMVLGLAHGCIMLLAAGLGWLSAWPQAVWQAPVPPGWLFGGACLGLAWLLAPAGWPCRWLGLPLMLPLVLLLPTRPATGTFTVTAFDVGQGMAVLVETAGHRLLYDTGPAYSPETDGASRVLLPYLRGRGIARLDAVVISHNDADHSGGAATLLRAIAVDWSSSSLAPGSPLLQLAPAHRHCIAGQAWEWEGIRFEMLHPVDVTPARTKEKPNARSCTLKIGNARHAILLAGDIEAAQEAALLKRGAALRADVLLAPHHGSGTSSTLPFLKAVQPQMAIFQVGYRNRYRHPKEEVWQRYGALGIDRLRTDEDGALLLEIGDDIQVKRWRIEAARYWHAQDSSARSNSPP